MPLLARSYAVLSRHRLALALATLACLAVLAVLGARLRVGENVAALLPEGNGVAEDFRLLAEAPFSRKVLVNLTLEAGAPREALLESVDRVAASLAASPNLQWVLAKPAADMDPGFFVRLGGMAGLFASPDNMGVVRQRIQPEAVARELAELAQALRSLEGMAVKPFAREDPLGLRELVLPRLAHLRMLDTLRVDDEGFLSADGRSGLILAEAHGAMTDSADAETLGRDLDGRVQVALEPGVRAVIFGAHRYVAANAATIKRDLGLVITVSSLAVLAVFLLFLRSWSLLVLLAFPGAVFAAATGTLALTTPAVSGITLGFGAVLIGISVDYAIHVSVALSRRDGPPGMILADIATPLSLSAVTSMAVFAVLAFSGTPVLRELAVFSLAGLAAALLLALFVLPQFLPCRDCPVADALAGPLPAPRRGRLIVILWCLALAACLGLGLRASFNGDLRAISVFPAEIRADEELLQRTWGGVGDQTVIFCRGADLETALACNDRVWDWLASGRADIADAWVSLAAVLPSRARQQANLERWTAFWTPQRREQVAGLLRTEGARQGFAANAFAPFIDGLAEPPAPLTVQDLRGAGLGVLVDSLIFEQDGETVVATLAPDAPGLGQAFAASGLEEGPAGARLVSRASMPLRLGAALRDDFERFVGLAVGLLAILLLALFRSPRAAAAAAAPFLSALAAILGLSGLGVLELTLPAIASALLVLGLGVDYGIFMTYSRTRGRDHATARAVLISGLTTAAGFGALALARHPVLHGIGVTVLAGIAAAIVTALVVTPALCGPGCDRRLA